LTRYYRVGYIIQDGEKEVEAGGSHNFDVRGDRRSESNVEGVVIDWNER
jgi:hypothetical protein